MQLMTGGRWQWVLECPYYKDSWQNYVDPFNSFLVLLKISWTVKFKHLGITLSRNYKNILRVKN